MVRESGRRIIWRAGGPACAVMGAAFFLYACGSGGGTGNEAGGVTGIACRGNSAEVSGPGASAEEGLITIREAGVYEISGSFEGQLAIDAGKEDVVEVRLNGLTVTGTDSAAVNGIQSKKIILTLQEGTQNVLSDAAAYRYQDAMEDEPDAAIFSKDDIMIQGKGSLEVYGNYKDGIRSKDGLVIASGNLSVDAQEDAIVGKDSVTVKDGTFRITAGGDGIKSNHDGDEEKGYVTIEKGNLTIDSGDDGIHAETALRIEDGVIDIQGSREGLEGSTVTVDGGSIRVRASNDGINAAGDKKEDGEAIAINMNGGWLYVNAGGDGIDSNGNFTVAGGTLLVEGPEDDGNASIDYDGKAVITGGTVIATGSAGMVQGFSEESSQGSVLLYFNASQKAGTLLSLADSQGETLLAFCPSKTFASAVISSPDLKQGFGYTVTLGGEIQAGAVDGYYEKENVSGGTQAAQFLLDKQAVTLKAAP